MILVNSAEFDYLEIDLSKDLFFAGDNGTGKTSSIIALFYLFSGDNNSRKLGISSDKKSFKDYYFPDNRNSFMIYLFDDFFIFMYKSHGEVFKHFSKQTFDIDEITRENGSLIDFKDIQAYVRKAPLTYLSKSREDYRSIIYGQNRDYPDFKITTIKHYEIFVELFNQTFNVDKSIIDANSIKKAIQKSLNHSDSVIEFSYEKYIEEIKRFQDTYLFFRKFEREGDRIDSAYETKKRLLSFEKSVSQLESNIRYRDGIEAGLLENNKKQKDILEIKEREFEDKEKSLYQLSLRCDSIFIKKKAKLELDIRKIEKLEQRFEKTKREQARSLLHKEPQLRRELSETLEQITLLKANVSSAVESVAREINSLKYRRDTELSSELKAKKIDNQRREQEESDRYKERTRQARELFDNQSENSKKNHNFKIEQNEKIRDEKRRETNQFRQEYRDILNKFKEQKESQRRAFVNQKEDKVDEQRQKKRELQELQEQSKSTKKRYTKDRLKLIDILLEERRYIHKEIANQKAILSTPKGSFKEFLQQSGLAWERELYPFMDIDLLGMSSEVLTPQIINEDMPLGLKLDMSSLKQIPTQEEAEDKIYELKLKLQQARQIYKEEQKLLSQTQKRGLQKIDEDYAHIEYSIKEIEKEKIELDKKRRDIIAIEIPQKERELKDEESEKIASLQKDISDLDIEIRQSRSEIDNLKLSIREFATNQKDELNKNQRVLKTIKDKEDKNIQEWYTKEVSSINLLIKEKESSKEAMTKDEKIVSLDKKLKLLNPEIENINEAKEYLVSYEKQRLFIQSIDARRSRLDILIQNREQYKLNISNQESNTQNQKSQNQKQIVDNTKEMLTLTDGIEKSRVLGLKGDSIEATDIYLVDLIAQYHTTKREYKDDKLNLKDTLDRLNDFKINPFTHISFDLKNLQYFTNFSEDVETIERIDELKEFRDKKFEPLKRTTNEEYLNFIKNEIPLKLDTLSHSEDKFQSQVKRINENLSTIDFSIVKDIKILTQLGNKRSIMKLLGDIRDLVLGLDFKDTQESLFFNRKETSQDLQKISILLQEIKETLNGGAITLLDTIDLALEFTENGNKKTDVTQIKNESSTGGTILLKMALAVSILGLYTDEKQSTFFLILDEVSRLHSYNQDLLRQFANSRGFRIVFVTPEPIYAKPDEIKYYKFQRRGDNRFEVISLNCVM